MSEHANETVSPEETASPVQVLMRQFQANDWVIERAVEGFEAEDWAFTHGASSPAAWIVGHLAGSRRNAARAAGVPLEEQSWEAAFGFGSNAHAELPLTPADALAALKEAGDALYTKLQTMTPAQAKETSPMNTPDGRNDRLSLLGFLSFHESYHAGQLGLLRRQRNKDRIV